MVRVWAEGGAACNDATSGALCLAKAAFGALSLVPVAAALFFLDFLFPEPGQGLALGITATAAVGTGVPGTWTQRGEAMQKRPDFLRHVAVSALG